MYLGPGIVLSLVNKQGKDIQGYLRLNELFNLDYPADLIVLSACETGLGKNIQGEGLVGLTRGLMYAGGERLVLSLWQVEDKGTSMLMQEFYKEMLLNGKSGNVAPYPNFLSGYVAKNETNTAQAQVDA
ncbi:MAG: CHAT domain-containing protein [Stigonema ocellatum SAG 48.90 = DSM 106950]|nr:CHAT domain-containing protein [Stigonema ocellatum SAG 48.90 = DSM 106950]